MKIKKLLSLILSLAISAAIIPAIPAHAETEAANIATHGGGLAPVTAEEREYVQEHQVETEIRLFSMLPSSVDNSSTKYFPAIGNQGSYAGSCAAWATTYYQLSYTIAKALDANASSYTFAPNWTYSLSNDGKNEGCYKHCI